MQENMESASDMDISEGLDEDLVVNEWTPVRYDELMEQYKALHSDDIDRFLDGFVYLPRPRAEMTTEEICFQIAKQRNFNQVVDRFDEL